MPLATPPSVRTAAGAPDEDGIADPARRRAALASCWLSILLAVIDASIANVALPSISTDLKASASSAIWVINAYQIAIIVSLLPLASLGEIVGFRRVYLAGLLLFTAASLACAASPDLTLLALARMVQGLGAAGIMSLNAALLRHIVPAARFGRTLATNALFVAAGAAAGPAIAGGILAVAPWPFLFLVNLPIGLAALALGHRALPAIAPAARRFDRLGAVLNVVAFGGSMVGLDLLLRGGIGLGPGAAGLLAGGLAMAGLIRRARATASPLLPVDLLALPVFAAAAAVSCAAFVGITAAAVAIPFLLERGLGRAPATTGVLMASWPVSIMIGSRLVGAIVDRADGRTLASLGLAVAAGGLALAAAIGRDASDLSIVLRLAVVGAGFALFQSPNNREMLSAAPRARAGAAAGALSVARLTGQTLGAILAAMVFADGAAGLGPAREILSVAAAILLAAALASLGRVGLLARRGAD